MADDKKGPKDQAQGQDEAMRKALADFYARNKITPPKETTDKAPAPGEAPLTSRDAQVGEQTAEQGKKVDQALDGKSSTYKPAGMDDLFPRGGKGGGGGRTGR